MFRHIWCPGLNFINWELVTAFDNDKLKLDIERSLNQDPTNVDKENVEQVRKNFDDFIQSGRDILKEGSENELNENVLSLLSSLGEIPLILVEGITVLNHLPTSNLCDIKFFLTLDFETCSKRRDLRRYDPPDIDGYFKQVVWPEYEKLLADVHLKYDKNVISFPF